jgi:hypothetical protein
MHGALQVGCSILLSRWPLKGWFRYRDRFQILPVPPQAPKNEGTFENNPFSVEVKFDRSSDPTVIGRRHSRAVREIELLLSAFAVVTFRQIKVGSHWVRDDHDPGGAVVLAQESYHWPGRQGLLDDFSDVSDVPSLTLIPSNQYYTQSPTASFDLPSAMSAALDAFYRLDASPRERFLRAAYWVNHAGSVSSDSASFVALVQAIEAVMPPQSSEECPTCGKPNGDGPTAAFQKFVDQFSRGLSEKERKDFYGARSSLTHGRHLHHWDADGFSLSPTASVEQANHRQLFRVVRIVLLNWLWHQQDPALF